MASRQSNGGIFHMQIEKVLGRREKKALEELLEKNYGCRIALQDYNIFMTAEEKIWLASPSINFSIFDVLKRCYRIGIYFGKLKRNNKIKLSIEGAMIVGKKARKNVVVINKEEAKKFMQGYDVVPDELIEAEMHNFVIVKCGDDIMGTGILRDGYVENLIPKARRMVKM